MEKQMKRNQKRWDAARRDTGVTSEKENELIPVSVHNPLMKAPLILSPFAAVAFLGLRHFAQRAKTNRLFHLHARTLKPCVTTILSICCATAWRHVACFLVRKRKSRRSALHKEEPYVRSEDH